VLWLAPKPQAPVTPISLANFRLLKQGMPLSEVVGILGPPGDYATADTEYDKMAAVQLRGAAFLAGTERIDAFGKLAKGDGIAIWSGDTANVMVFFDKTTGKVSSGRFMPMKMLDESLFTRLRKRVTRQWHKWFP
jgi:hypothetical protein